MMLMLEHVVLWSGLLALSSANLPLRFTKREWRLFSEPHRRYFMAHACQDSLMELHCGEGNVINLTRVMYGRQSLTQCVDELAGDDWNLHCLASPRRSHRRVASRCSGQSRCLIPVASFFFGNPCPGTPKYLEVYYACVPAPGG